MFETITINGKEYRLRLTTRTSIAMEKALGYNPIEMLMNVDDGTLPKLGDVLIMLHSMLQALNHGITMNDVYDLFDEYVADGHTMFDLVPIFINVFKQSGYIGDANVQEDDAKNE